MKTLGEICEAVSNGQRPDYEDLRYAVLAQQALLTFDRLAFMKLAETEREGKKPVLVRSAQFQWEEYFRRVKTALGKAPKEYVGWNNDPDNPEFQHRRGIAIKLYDRVADSATGEQ